MKLSTFVLACAVLMVAVVYGSPDLTEVNVSTKTCPCPEDFPRETDPDSIQCPPKKRMMFVVDQHGVPKYADKYVFAVYCTKCSCGNWGVAVDCLDLTHKGLYECDEPVNPENFWYVTHEIEKGSRWDQSMGPYWEYVERTGNATTTTKRMTKSTTKAPDFPRETDPTKIKCPPKSRMGFFTEGNGPPDWQDRYFAFVYCTSCRCAENGYFDICHDLTHQGLYGCYDPHDPSKFWDGVDPNETE